MISIKQSINNFKDAITSGSYGINCIGANEGPNHKTAGLKSIITAIAKNILGYIPVINTLFMSKIRSYDIRQMNTTPILEQEDATQKSPGMAAAQKLKKDRNETNVFSGFKNLPLDIIATIYQIATSLKNNL
jgi:ABC-type uncharacterized transport system permease subunit